jgi:uncharacterized RDD family membrane protein YckC/type II secretory pathway pseudopilin PulG
MDDRASIQYATFWPRVAARIIDNAILMFCGGVLAAAVAAVAVAAPPSSGDRLATFVVLWAVTYFVLAAAYFVTYAAISGRTPGKRWMGLRVVSGTGASLTWGQSVIRFLVDLVFGVLMVVGFLDPLWVSWDRRRQAIHDKAAGTMVVRERPSTSGPVVAAVLLALLLPGSVLGYALLPILSVVVLPVMSRSREQERERRCMANFHGLAMAVRMYRMDEGAYPPPYDPTTGQGGLNTLYPTYLSRRVALVCPDDSTAVTDYNAAHGAHWDSSSFQRLYSSYNDTYNYWGYDRRGELLKRQAEAASLYANKEDYLGRALWETDVPSAVFPGLANRNAPDYTIIAHCSRHSGAHPARAREDLIIRLDGSVRAVETDAYDWVVQPAN